MAGGVEVGTAYVTVLPSTQGFHKALAADVDAASTKAGTSGGVAAGKGFTAGFGKAAAGIGAAMAGVFTAGKVAQLTGEAISAASNLAESQAKIDVVFGTSAQVVNDWAQTSSTAMLMSSQAALEAAGTYGNLFQAFGIGQQKSQEMSQNLVQLAADLASFNNTSVDDALLALQSGLSGETEPLKRYGVALTDARLKAEAMTLGLFDGVGQMDAATKAQASYALILQDTALAQGDVKRTADGYANTVRSVNAEIENQKAIVGGELLKAIQDASASLGGPQGLVDMVKGLGGNTAEAAGAVGTLAGAVVALGSGIAGLPTNESTPEWFRWMISGDHTLDWSWLPSSIAPLVRGYDDVTYITDMASNASTEIADMSFQNRLLNQALNQTPYAADPATTAIEGVGSAADTSRKAVDDLRTSLAKLAGKNDLRSSRLAIQDSWAALDTMGENRPVKVKVKNPNWKPGSKSPQFITQTKTVQDAFDPGVHGGRFSASDSGRQGEQWAISLAQQYMDRASLFSEQGKPKAAANTLDQGQAALAAQFAKWGITKPKAYADSFIPEAPWLKRSIRNDAIFQDGMTGYDPKGTSQRTIIYQFTGDIIVPTVIEAARRANELARLKALSGGQIPAQASV